MCSNDDVIRDSRLQRYVEIDIGEVVSNIFPVNDIRSHGLAVDMAQPGTNSTSWREGGSIKTRGEDSSSDENIRDNCDLVGHSRRFLVSVTAEGAGGAVGSSRDARQTLSFRSGLGGSGTIRFGGAQYLTFTACSHVSF